MRAMLSATSLAFVSVLAACGDVSSPPSDTQGVTAEAVAGDGAATVTGNTYGNATIGLTVTAPDGWYVAPSDVMNKLMASGQELVTSEMDESSQAAMQGALQRTMNLFTFTEHPPGAPVDSTATVLGVAEDVGAMPGVSRGSDYFFHARKLMEQSPMQMEFADEYGSRMIGGQSFDRMDIEMEVLNRQVKQQIYAARNGDYILSIITAYQTEEQRQDIEGVLDSIKLDW